MKKNKLTHSGNLIILGFAMALGLMSFLVYKSIKQEVQMVSVNYYEDELKFQDKIDAKENAKPYYDEFTLNNTDDILQIQIPKPLCKYIENGEIQIYCISDIEQDKLLKILPSESGIYQFTTKDWKKTEYTAKISFTNNGKQYLREMVFFL